MAEAAPPSDSFKTVLIGVASAAIGAVSAIVVAGLTGSFSYASKDEELRVHLVEIAIGILRADPTKEDVAPARGWAIDIIERDSGVKFEAADRAALLHKPLGWRNPDEARMVGWFGDLFGRGSVPSPKP
jgi:hypothetical protein